VFKKYTQFHTLCYTPRARLISSIQRVEDHVPNLTGRNPGDLGPSWPDHATLVRVFSDPAAQSGFAKVLFYVF
jgi:hypothetical protein